MIHHTRIPAHAHRTAHPEILEAQPPCAARRLVAVCDTRGPDKGSEIAPAALQSKASTQTWRNIERRP